MTSELRRFLGSRIDEFFEDDYGSYTPEDVHANIGGEEVDDVSLELVKEYLDQRVKAGFLDVSDGLYSRGLDD